MSKQNFRRYNLIEVDSHYQEVEHKYMLHVQILFSVHVKLVGTLSRTCHQLINAKQYVGYEKFVTHAMRYNAACRAHHAKPRNCLAKLLKL